MSLRARTNSDLSLSFQRGFRKFSSAPLIPLGLKDLRSEFSRHFNTKSLHFLHLLSVRGYYKFSMKQQIFRSRFVEISKTKIRVFELLFTDCEKIGINSILCRRLSCPAVWGRRERICAGFQELRKHIAYGGPDRGPFL